MNVLRAINDLFALARPTRDSTCAPALFRITAPHTTDLVPAPVYPPRHKNTANPARLRPGADDAPFRPQRPNRYGRGEP